MTSEVILLNGLSSHSWRHQEFLPQCRLWGCNSGYEYWPLHGVATMDSWAQDDVIANYQGLRITGQRRQRDGFTSWPAPGVDSGSLLASYVLSNSENLVYCIGLDHHWQEKTQQGTGNAPLSRHGHQLWIRAWRDIIDHPRFFIVTDYDCTGQKIKTPQAEQLLLTKTAK
jgi:hypothetical protein